ncbi:hypothetical protein XSR1_30145 [Xenorhabdus szentirmaii DSM 16338]|uniref:Transposase n=1 Tax=Xenorhabdus szentirmaii DSM 16338 TaxID=1427518 RepID=W1J084_9GAMM|nr:hypothetical protein XSR1_30145 [Xenorhabdus szentirmaii DSM 16338]
MSGSGRIIFLYRMKINRKNQGDEFLGFSMERLTTLYPPFLEKSLCYVLGVWKKILKDMDDKKNNNVIR